MFLGQYRHSFDEKGRITIPARFRELLMTGAYVVQGFDRNLMLFNEEQFTQISERISRKNMADPNARQLRRHFFSNADHAEVDKAGRILIQQFLRDYANLNGEAVVVGNGDYIEIWDPALWEQQEALQKDSEENAQRFIAFDLSSD